MSWLRKSAFKSAVGTSGDVDASNYFDRITAAGSSISGPQMTAVELFVAAAKAGGYWSKLIRINVFFGADLTAALVPLKVGGGNATDTNNNFISGDFSSATGLTGNGSTKYLDTGIVPSTMLTANDTHVSSYFTNTSTGSQNAIGALNGSDHMWAAFPWDDNSAYSDQYDSGSGRVSAGGMDGPNQAGFFVATRTASNSHKIYRNGSQIATSTGSGGSLGSINFPMYVFAFNNGGSPGGRCNKAMGAYSIGTGLSGSDVTAYNTDLETLLDSVSRGVQ